MIDKGTEKALEGIVQGYFDGGNLLELITGARDQQIISNLKNLYENFKK